MTWTAPLYVSTGTLLLLFLVALWMLLRPMLLGGRGHY